MDYKKINKIVAAQFNITPHELMNVRGYAGSYPRCAAMLICHEVLKASTLKLRDWYQKKDHTTPMRALTTAHNRLQLDKDFRMRYQAALFEVKASIVAEKEKKKQKQVYNLNHRVKLKGIDVSTRTHTVRCTEAHLAELKGKQLAKLIHNHNYVIQLQLL